MIRQIAPALLASLLLATPPLGAALAQQPSAVSALGFVEPEGGVYRVSGTISSDGSTVAELLVSEGDRVEAGQIIATLDNNPRLTAAIGVAEAQVEIREAKLALVKAGVSVGAINVQKARVDRLAIELETATAECARIEELWRRKVASDSQRDETCLEQRVLERQIAEAKAQLEDLIEVRIEEVAVAEAELQDAKASLLRAEADYLRSVVRAPITGRILDVHTKPGEFIAERGVVEMGQTDRMWIQAEVYETDISRVRLGQRASVTSDGFEGTLGGTVEHIGLLIGKNEILATDPTADVDARVVEIKIRLDAENSATVADLTNLQVAVIIDTGASTAQSAASQ
ncbi:MAG: HlyD family efflux transporter periplasmic adaptor subunit [Rhodospirillaceae bacterium]